MSRGMWLACPLIVSVACTQDYDTFHFASGGAAATGGATTTSAGGDGNGGSGTGAAGGAGASGAGGDTTTSMGGEGTGGTPDVVQVPCGSGGTCVVSDGDACCVAQGGDTDGTCDGNCSGNQATLECNEPSDCPAGDSCCLVLSGSNYESTQCKATCGATDDVICDPESFEPCGVDECNAVADLPMGFRTCL